MIDVEQIDRSEVVALNNRNVQHAHQACRRHSKIIPHHHDGLQLPAITLPQSLHQFGVRLCSMSMQPLFELVDDNHDLLWGRLPACRSVCGR